MNSSPRSEDVGFRIFPISIFLLYGHQTRYNKYIIYYNIITYLFSRKNTCSHRLKSHVGVTLNLMQNCCVYYY